MTSESHLTSEQDQGSAVATDGAGREGFVTFATVGVRALARNVSGTVADVARSRRPALVTRHGVPIAAIVPIERGVPAGESVTQATRSLQATVAEGLGLGRQPTPTFRDLARRAHALDAPASSADAAEPRRAPSRAGELRGDGGDAGPGRP